MKLTWLFLLLAGCATSNIYPSAESVYWDQPATDRYWVPEGVEVAAILDASEHCGATVEGGIANHGIAPPGFSVHVFYFIGESSETSRECTVKRLHAVPKLTTYLRKY